MITTPHSPYDPACSSQEHCYSHEVDEPAAGAFKVCFECFHIYPTVEDLVREDAFWHDGVRRPVEEIYVCAHCSHDL